MSSVGPAATFPVSQPLGITARRSSPGRILSPSAADLLVASPRGGVELWPGCTGGWEICGASERPCSPIAAREPRSVVSIVGAMANAGPLVLQGDSRRVRRNPHGRRLCLRRGSRPLILLRFVGSWPGPPTPALGERSAGGCTCPGRNGAHEGYRRRRPAVVNFHTYAPGRTRPEPGLVPLPSLQSREVRSSGQDSCRVGAAT